MKDLISQFHIESDSSSRVYVVSKYTDGSWACSCPAWIFKKGQRVNCKHINQVISQNQEHYQTATIDAVKPTEEVLAFKHEVPSTKIEFKHEDKNVVMDKMKFYTGKPIELHINKECGEWLNCFILQELEEGVYLIKERKFGEQRLFLSEIDGVEEVRETEEQTARVKLGEIINGLI